MDAHDNGKGTSATTSRALALFVVLVVGALGVAALVGSLRMGVWDRAGPGPGLFPLLASMLIVGCTAVRLLTKFQLVANDAAPHWRRESPQNPQTRMSKQLPSPRRSSDHSSVEHWYTASVSIVINIADRDVEWLLTAAQLAARDLIRRSL